ncbi:hypothetical protein JCM3765_005417 [Sporobolomyces pararoseus]
MERGISIVHSDSEDEDYLANFSTPPPLGQPSSSDLNFAHTYSATPTDDSGKTDEHLQAEDQYCKCQIVPEKVGCFERLAKHKLDATGTHMHVAKWRSEKTGLTVIWADTPDLISSLSITVVTEASSSSAVPHALEHLVFSASEKYPWSNVLDSVAGRLMARGVNGTTKLDCTTYSFESASEEGVLKVLPVYLDHIFFPSLDEGSFKTEIYHVNGKGEEGGALFTELQEKEGSRAELMALAQQRALYNDSNAYRYDTGGTLTQLRGLMLQQIKDYHKAAYVPQNTTIVVTGYQVDPKELLDTISRTIELDLEKSGLARGSQPQNWIRPFVESITAENEPILAEDKTALVPYNSTDDSIGQITISFLGPRLQDSLAISALGVLGDYLVGSPHAVLNRKLVEIPEPACTNISFKVAYREPTVVTVTLDAVPQDRLLTLGEELKSTFRELSCEPLDMPTIQQVILQQAIGLKKIREAAPDTYVQAAALQDIIYGEEKGWRFSNNFNDLEMLKSLSRWNEADWGKLFKQYFVDCHSVVLIGTPSPQLARESAEEQEARVVKMVQKFGTGGLARLDQELKEAQGAYRLPPQSFIQTFALPDFHKISWLSVDTARSNGVGRGREAFFGKAQRIINADGPELPIFIQFDHCPSAFVTVSVLLHGAALPILPLYIDTFFTLPIELPGGRCMSWEEVSRRIDNDLVSCDASAVHEGIWITLTALKENYSKAVALLSDVLYGTSFDIDRLRRIVETRSRVLPSIKEIPGKIAKAAIRRECFTEASFESPTNPLNVLEYYPQLKLRLQDDPQDVIKDLETLRRSLLDTRSMRFSVIGDILKIENPSSTWLDCFETVEPFPASQLAPISRPRQFLTPLGSRPGSAAIVYRVESLETSYLTARSRCPDWDDPSFPALEVACSILSQTNGLLWRVTRGAGLSYGVSISQSCEHGFISLNLESSPTVLTALSAAQDLLRMVAAGTIKISENEIETAKSEIAFSIVEDECTPTKAAAGSFFDTVILKKPKGFARLYLEQVDLVTPEDVQRVIRTWILPLVDPRTSVVGVSTSPAKASAIVGGLAQLGYKVKQQCL